MIDDIHDLDTDALRDIDAIELRLSDLLDSMPDAITEHIDYLPDDFHADPACYLSMLPRLADSIDFPAFYDNFAPNIASLNLTDADLLALIALQFIDHDCAEHTD